MINPFRKDREVNWTNLRLFVWKNGCPYCRLYLGVINNLINCRLPPQKRIMCINVQEMDKYGFNTFPFLEKLKFNGVPYLYFEGIEVQGAITREECEGKLMAFTENDFIV